MMPSDSEASGFLSLLDDWKGQVGIADDFDELPDDLAEALGMKP
jgi:hypothetical protein